MRPGDRQPSERTLEVEFELPGVWPPPPFDINARLPALVAENGAVFVVSNRSHPCVTMGHFVQSTARVRRPKVP